MSAAGKSILDQIADRVGTDPLTCASGFEAVTSIIFCVALSEYDQVLLEENGQVRKHPAPMCCHCSQE